MSKLEEKELLKTLLFWKEMLIKQKDVWAEHDEQAYKQIVYLIKILFAKEISEGPIKKDISQPELIGWLQGINQAATAVKDYYVMKATTQLIEMAAKKITITEKDIRGWADEASDRVNEYKDWDYVEDAMKEMLKEIGVEVVKK